MAKREKERRGVGKTGRERERKGDKEEEGKEGKRKEEGKGRFSCCLKILK